MGEIADMMLEGLLDDETGEYIGDINEGIYGDEAPGFPISYERQRREKEQRQSKAMLVRYTCPLCNKRIKKIGLQNHVDQCHQELAQDMFSEMHKFLIKKRK